MKKSFLFQSKQTSKLGSKIISDRMKKFSLTLFIDSERESGSKREQKEREIVKRTGRENDAYRERKRTERLTG